MVAADVLSKNREDEGVTIDGGRYPAVSRCLSTFLRARCRRRHRCIRPFFREEEAASVVIDVHGKRGWLFISSGFSSVPIGGHGQLQMVSSFDSTFVNNYLVIKRTMTKSL